MKLTRFCYLTAKPYVCQWKFAYETEYLNWGLSQRVSHIWWPYLWNHPGEIIKKHILYVTPWNQLYSLSKSGSDMCLLPCVPDWDAVCVHWGKTAVPCRNIKVQGLATLLQVTSNFTQASKGHSVDAYDIRCCSHFSCGPQMLCQHPLSTCVDKSKENVNNGKRIAGRSFAGYGDFKHKWNTHTSASPWQRAFVPLNVSLLWEWLTSWKRTGSKSGAPSTFRHWLMHPVGDVSIPTAAWMSKGCCALAFHWKDFTVLQQPELSSCAVFTFIRQHCTYDVLHKCQR